jgi:YD repeat-containing protein
LWLERLEDRTLLTIQPLTLADPSLYGVTANGASSSPSVSADGQLIAFTSKADNLVPNDMDNLPDAFVYNCSTGTVTLVSVGLNGMAAGIDGTAPVISPDGRYVVFESGGSYLDQPIVSGVSGDQLYLRDLSTGTTSLLSVNVAGKGANGTSTDAIFSADSHHVGFLNSGNNLVAGVKYNSFYGADVYERDLVTGTTALVSISLDGQSNGNAGSGPFGLSADGRFVVFQSSASNLVSISNSGIEQVYVRDMVSGTTRMVSVDVTGLAGGAGHCDLNADSQVISADGRYVVFHSNATDIVASGGNGCFLRDLRTDTTVLLSASAVDGSAVGGNGSEVVSPDGRWAAFATAANNVVVQPTNGNANVYVRNIQTGTLSLASSNAAGTAGGNGNSGIGTFYDFPGGLSFSPDGTYLAFRSLATDLTANVATANRNLYVHNLDAGTTLLVTPNQAGTDGGNGDADTVRSAVFSTNGQYIAFEDMAGNLVGGDNNRQNDVFVRNLQAGTTSIASAASPLLPAAFPVEAASSLRADSSGSLYGVSANGRFVVFTSDVFYGASYSQLAPGVTFSSTFSTHHVFVRDRQTGTIQVVDVDSSGTAMGGFDPVITPDGRYVVFIGYTNLLPSGVTYRDVHDEILYVRDLQQGTLTPVSVDPSGTHDVSLASNSEIALSPDGRYVAFTTPYAGTTFPGVSDPNNFLGVFLRDQGTATTPGTTYFVSHDPANDGQVNGSSNDISISADGRYVCFQSNDSGLTGNPSRNVYQVFRWDQTTGQVALVSINNAGTAGGNSNGAAFDYPPVMSADGRYIAFDSNSTDLVPEDPNHLYAESIFLRDMGNGTTQPSTQLIVGTNSGGIYGPGTFAPAITPDGGTIAFVSNAPLTTDAKHTHSTENVYVTGSGGLTLVSVNDVPTDVNPNGPFTGTGNGNSGGPGPNGTGAPVISADGRYVVFQSLATDLFPGFVAGHPSGYLQGELFERDLKQGLTKLVSYNQSGTAGGNAGEATDNVQLSGDGTTLVFDSTATDLFAGDRNYQTNIFATPSTGFSSISGQVFNDRNGNGSQDTGETGLPYWTVFLDLHGTGKISADDPTVLTDTSGNYSFTGLTPGTYTVVVVPQAGHVQTTPTAPASYTVTVATDGTAITGKDFGEELPLPELVASNISFSPTSSGPGQPVTFSWTVTNQGNAAAAGSWEDAIYLSPTPTLGSSAELIATVPHTGGLAVNGNYAGSTTVNLPPVALGSYYAIVQADWRNQVFEGPFLAHESEKIAVSASTLSVSVPTLKAGTPVQGTFTGAGQGFYYQVSVAPGQTLTLTLNSAATSGANELYIRRGSLPDPSDFDLAARIAGQPNQTLSVPTTTGGTYYVCVRTVYGAASTSGFTLNATLPTFGITSIDEPSGGNTGNVTIPIHGTLLTESTQANLVSGSTVIPAESVFFQDASEIFATFNLAGARTGSYDVQLADGSQSTTLAGAFAVVTGAAGVGPVASPVQITLTLPSAVRAGSSDGVVVRWVNTGNIDAVAPLLTVSADHALLHLPDWPDASGTSIEFLGISSNGPAGILRPGQSGQLTIPFLASDTPGEINFTTQIADDTQAMNWANYKSSLQPVTIPNAVWDVIYANFTGNVGDTIGSYHSVLANDATYLSQLGEYTPDVNRLLEFELNKAAAIYTAQTLTTVIDVTYPEPGLNLTFVRQFQQSIGGRFTMGSFGLGWTDNWHISASIDALGNVSIADAGAIRYFLRQPDGTYQGAMGDLATLSLVNGAFQLRETDRTLEVFNPNGTLAYMQDGNGNRITVSYTGGLLTSLTAADGDQIAISYNTAGLITQLTDPGNEVTTFAFDPSNQHLVRYTD